MTPRFTPIRAAVLAFCLALSACASTYSPESMTGGFSEKLVYGDVWMVGYSGNGYTTEETVQTYWLYHCAEITLAKGFDAFEILPPTRLSSQAPAAEGLLVRVDSSRAMNEYARSQKPWLYGQIRLLRKPFTPVPAKRFDAAALKAMLDPLVNGKKCGGNVCPYVHRYLYPDL